MYKNYLDGSAKQAVGGFPVINEAYEEAFTLLKNHYRNLELIITSHMNKLIKLEKVVNSNVKELRHLFDRVEDNIRALNTIGINSDHFGPQLIRIVLQKFTNVIHLQISHDSQDTTILLQIVDAKFVNNKNYHYVAKVLFDFCSQKTYIAKEVVRKLNLMTLQEINVA